MIKFIYFEKATKFSKISTVDLTGTKFCGFLRLYDLYGPLSNTLSGWCPAIAGQCCRHRRARSRPFSMKNQYFASTIHESFQEISDQDMINILNRLGKVVKVSLIQMLIWIIQIIMQAVCEKLKFPVHLF